MADVFISYKSGDRPRVAAIAAALEANGYSVWWDAQMEVSSKSYPQQIWDALTAAKAVIVAWSANGVVSDWVTGEAVEAKRVGKLIQVLLEPCALRPPFNMLQYADLSGWTGIAADPSWRTVVDQVAKLTGKPPLSAIAAQVSSAQVRPAAALSPPAPTGGPPRPAGSTASMGARPAAAGPTARASGAPGQAPRKSGGRYMAVSAIAAALALGALIWAIMLPPNDSRERDEEKRGGATRQDTTDGGVDQVDYRANALRACNQIFDGMASASATTGARLTAMRGYCGCWLNGVSVTLSDQDWRNMADALSEARRRAAAVGYEPRATQQALDGMRSYGEQMPQYKLDAMNASAQRCAAEIEELIDPSVATGPAAPAAAK